MAAATSSGDEEAREIIAGIEATPIATVVTDCRLPDNPIVAVNAAFCALTGYARDEVIGRNCRLLAGAGTEPEARAAIRDAIADGRPIVVELTNYRRDGSPFRNAVMIAPLCDREGRLALFVGSQMDVGGGSGSGLRRARARKLLSTLTRRQRQVLQLMIAGFRNKQIAGELGIDEKTVKMHRAALIRSLGAATSADAVRIAVEGELREAESR